MPKFSFNIHLSEQQVIELVREWVHREFPNNANADTTINVNVAKELRGYGRDEAYAVCFKGIDINFK